LFDELRRKPDAIPFFHIPDAWGILEMRELKRRLEVIKDEIRREHPMVGGSISTMDELIFQSIDRVLAKRKH
jgi:hypothetical protein